MNAFDLIAEFQLVSSNAHDSMVVKWLSVWIWAVHRSYAGSTIFQSSHDDWWKVEGNKIFRFLSLKPQKHWQLYRKTIRNVYFWFRAALCLFFCFSLAIFYLAQSNKSPKIFITLHSAYCIAISNNNNEVFFFSRCLFGCCFVFFFFYFYFFSSTTIFLIITITKRAATCRSRKRYYIS